MTLRVVKPSASARPTAAPSPDPDLDTPPDIDPPRHLAHHRPRRDPLTGSDSTLRGVPGDPDDFRPSFDVVDELIYARERYTTSPTEGAAITLYGLSQSCHTNLARLQKATSKESNDKRPNLFVTTTACIQNGIEVLSGNSSVIEFCALRDAFLNSPPTTNGEIQNFIASFFGFDFQGVRVKTKTNIRVTTEVYEAMGTLASQLGVSMNVVAGLAIMVTLAEQNSTIRDHAQEMERTVSTFLNRVSLRRRGARALMVEFGLWREGQTL